MKALRPRAQCGVQGVVAFCFGVCVSTGSSNENCLSWVYWSGRGVLALSLLGFSASWIWARVLSFTAPGFRALALGEPTGLSVPAIAKPAWRLSRSLLVVI